jgi:hypothetical protein
VIYCGSGSALSKASIQALNPEPDQVDIECRTAFREKKISKNLTFL